MNQTFSPFYQRTNVATTCGVHTATVFVALATRIAVLKPPYVYKETMVRRQAACISLTTRRCGRCWVSRHFLRSLSPHLQTRAPTLRKLWIRARPHVLARTRLNLLRQSQDHPRFFRQLLCRGLHRQQSLLVSRTRTRTLPRAEILSGLSRAERYDIANHRNDV